MSKIYISSETLDKLNNSNDSQKYSDLLKAFNVTSQKPEKRQSSASKSKTVNIAHVDNKLNQDDKIKNALEIMMKSLAKTRHNYTYSPQKAKELSRMLKEKRRKYPVAKPIKQSKPPRIKVIKFKKTKKASKSQSRPIANTADYNDLAGEYKSRQVEFGHGRAKSKEWNDEIARQLQKELKNRRKKNDWTDRFALK